MIEDIIKVQFGSDVDSDDYIARFVLDPVLNVDENGDPKTSFAPGESLIFQAHFSTNVQIDRIVHTDGELEKMPSASRKVETTQLFSNNEEADELKLPVVPASTSIFYYGRTGTLEAKGLKGGQIKLVSDVDTVPFHVKVTNDYTCDLYKLTCPAYERDELTKPLYSDDDAVDPWPISVVFYATLLED